MRAHRACEARVFRCSFGRARRLYPLLLLLLLLLLAWTVLIVPLEVLRARVRSRIATVPNTILSFDHKATAS